MAGAGGERELRTEDELLRRRKHVQRECDFILVLLLLHPFCEVGRLRQEKGEGGDGEDGQQGVGEGRVVGEVHACYVVSLVDLVSRALSSRMMRQQDTRRIVRVQC